MSVQKLALQYPIFTGLDGQPLESGYVYIGTAGLNPVTNPITVYWDEAQTIPVTQPIRTSGGYLISPSASIGNIYVDVDYSLVVKDKNQVTLNSVLTVDKSNDASSVYFTSSGTGANERNVFNRLSETVSVKDFGATGNGTTDDTIAIKEAFAHAETLTI
jgi:hypothetical protein